MLSERLFHSFGAAFLTDRTSDTELAILHQQFLQNNENTMRTKRVGRHLHGNAAEGRACERAATYVDSMSRGSVNRELTDPVKRHL